MTSIPDVVIKNGRIVAVQQHPRARLYLGAAIAAALAAAGLGGYILGQSGNPPNPAQMNAMQPAAAPTTADKPIEPPSALLVSANTAQSSSTAQQALQAAVTASLQQVQPASDDEERFVKAQQAYLQARRETPEQVKARLDKLANDPKALQAHNLAVTNRVVASPANDAPSELSKAVQASQAALKTAPPDAMSGALQAEAAVREAEGKTYVVRPGDTLWDIAQRLYGDPYQYKRLFEANPRVLAAPEHIFPGQVLRVPA